MTAADRIARLRQACGAYRLPNILADDVRGLCDDYETLAARCTLTDEETEAVRNYLSDDMYDGDDAPLDAILRRLLGDTS